MGCEQKSCDSFRLCDFHVPFLPNEKSIHSSRVIHIQSGPLRFRSDEGEWREEGWGGLRLHRCMKSGVVGDGETRDKLAKLFKTSDAALF